MAEKYTVVDYIDTLTGEVYPTTRIIARMDYVQDHYKDIRKSNNYMGTELGNYFHLMYEELNDMELEDEMIVRFLRLAANYMHYDNHVMTGLTRRKRVKGTVEELMKILNLSKGATSKTINYLIDKELVYLNEHKEILLNKQFVNRGKLEKALLKRNKEEKDIMTRVYFNGFRQLYDGTKPTQHKNLNVFIKILPFINVHHNVICINPLEEDITKVKPILWTEICALIGISSESSIKRIKRLIWNLEIDDMPCVGEFSFKCGKCIVVNPAIYYKGNQQERLVGVVNLFKIQKTA